MSEVEWRMRESRTKGSDQATIAVEVLAAELDEATSVLEQILANREWPAPVEARWWQTWLTYRDAITIPMGHERFQAVAHAFDYLSRMQRALQHGSRPMIDTDPMYLEEARRAVSAGKSALVETWASP